MDILPFLSMVLAYLDLQKVHNISISYLFGTLWEYIGTLGIMYLI